MTSFSFYIIREAKIPDDIYSIKPHDFPSVAKATRKPI